MIDAGVSGGKNERFSNLIPTTASVIWLETKDALKNPQKYCDGISVHNVCIVSSADLHRLDYKYDPNKMHQTFFHNKFFIERDRMVMDCAEEELVRRNREECIKDTHNIITAS